MSKLTMIYMRCELEMIVNENLAFTLAQINTALRQRLPRKPHISRTVLADTLKAALLVIKKLEDCPAERNSEATKLQRKEYAEWILQAWRPFHSPQKWRSRQ